MDVVNDGIAFISSYPKTQQPPICISRSLSVFPLYSSQSLPLNLSRLSLFNLFPLSTRVYTLIYLFIPLGVCVHMVWVCARAAGCAWGESDGYTRPSRQCLWSGVRLKQCWRPNRWWVGQQATDRPLKGLFFREQCRQQ